MKRASLRTHPAHWPRPARLALYLLTTLACAASGLLLAVEELDESRQSAQRQQQDLRVQYQSALSQVALRDGLQSRQTALEMQLVAQQVQLPSSTPPPSASSTSNSRPWKPTGAARSSPVRA
ncbi:hypothetical protein HBH1_03376 [Herbaspirillum sp. BH-1]|uniref:hypothetical protein n=1 Tax=Herbaspirillum sp. (strain BH-1) TaxID=2058884 RepID=UPI000CBCAFF2|nr:hypothetical protein [Herbaspirillum sp. BH-1]PLY58309.1 hypothetical protein HBH1_03376 [Herbaspirillum sp. BH-1]